MIAPGVNVLLYAFREDSERHAEYHAVLRIATHPAIFKPRDAVEAFIDTCLAAPAAKAVRADAGH